MGGGLDRASGIALEVLSHCSLFAVNGGTVSSITEESRTKGHFINQKAPVKLRTSLNFHRDDEQ